MTEYNVRIQLAMISVIQELKNAVDDFVNNDAGSVTDLYILTPAGYAFKLDSITIPTIVPLHGFRIKIGAINVDIPTSMISFMMPGIMLPITLGMNLNLHVPGSESWLYGGPLRENVWPPRAGNSGFFSQIQYYELVDAGIDGSVLLFALGIGYALNKAGLSRVAEYFIKRIMSKNTIQLTNETRKILEDVGTLSTNLATLQGDVTILKNNIGTSSPTIASYVSSINGLVTAIKLVVDKVVIEVLSDELDESTVREKLDSVLNEIGVTILDPETLNKKIDNISSKVRAKTYV